MKKIPFKHILLRTALLTAFMSGSSRAHAQSIDYASLETLFGEPVTTSATGSPQRVSEAPVDMEIITQDDIRRSGAKDIAEVLRGVSGVNVMQSARQDYDVNIRGYNQPYSSNLLVLVNGRQVYLDDYGYTVWSTIPVQLSEIRQIEIVKGPNTALFGFNAADGVINIVTVNPLYDKTSNVGVTGGTGNYRDAHIVQSYKVNDDFGIRVSAGASKSDEFNNDRGSNPNSVFTQPAKDEVNLDSIYQITPKSQIRVEASGSKVDQTEMIPFNFLTDAYYETNSVKTDYEADTSMGLIKATAYRNGLNSKFFGDLYDPGLASSVDNNVIVTQLGYTFKVGLSNTFRIMGEYRHNVAEGPVLGPPGSSIQDDIYALSGMWGWAINPDWDWTNSARVDRFTLSRTGPINPNDLTQNDNQFDVKKTEYSYNSGLVWKATPDDSFRVNTGRGLRMPSFFDLGTEATTGASLNEGLGAAPILQVGNPQMLPTVVTNYELGWNRKVKPIDGIFKADVFTEKTEDGQGIATTLLAPAAYGGAGNDWVFSSDNHGAGYSRSIGTELDLKGKFDENWSWGVNDTLERIQDHYSSPTASSAGQTPVDQATVHLGYQEDQWESDAFVYWTSKYKEGLAGPIPGVGPPPDPLVTVPSHISLSGRVGYKINDVTTVALSGQELEAQRSMTSTSIDTERRVFLSLDRNF